MAIILHSTQYRQMHERIGGENGIWGKLDDKNTGNSVQKWKSGINNSAEIFLGDKIMKTIIDSLVMRRADILHFYYYYTTIISHWRYLYIFFFFIFQYCFWCSCKSISKIIMYKYISAFCQPWVKIF